MLTQCHGPCHLRTVQVLDRSVDELSPEDHPLIFAVNMSTGKRFHTQPTDVQLRALYIFSTVQV